MTTIDIKDESQTYKPSWFYMFTPVKNISVWEWLDEEAHNQEWHQRAMVARYGKGWRSEDD